MTITARLLGSVEIRDTDGSKLDSLPGQSKLFGLLSYLLAAQPRGFHRRDKLFALLWPEVSQEQARHSLSQALHVLRGELGEAAIMSRGDGDVAVDEACVSCDAVEFERAVDAIEHEKALELYRGDLLEGWFIREASEFERWLEDERTRLREKAAGAAWALAHEHIAAGRLVDAERTAQRALLLVATDESEVRRFIEASAGAGDRAAAVRFYEKFAQRLQAQYEIEPAPVTVQCAERIRTAKQPDGRAPTVETTDSVRDLAPMLAEGSSPFAEPLSARRGAKRRWLLTGAALTVSVVAVLLAVGVTRAGTDGWRDRPLDPNIVAVLPFHAMASDSLLQSLSDGMPYLFYSFLTGEAGLQAVEPNTVIRQWTALREGGGAVADSTALKFATQFAAAQLIEGSVVQAGPQITLSAWIRSVPDGAVRQRQNVSGTRDSANLLVAQLAYGLLGEQLGESSERIQQLLQYPQDAVLAYLAGVRADRKHRVEDALEQFDRAMELDSGFALAAFAMVKTARKLGWPNYRFERGDFDLALRLQHHLSERDQAELNYHRATVGRFGADAPTTGLERLGTAQSWADHAPTDPHAAVAVAVALTASGRVSDIPNWRQQVAFYSRKAWNADSTDPNLLRGQMELAFSLRDTVWLQRVAPVYFSHADSTGDWWMGFRWSVGHLFGDSATVSDLRSRALTGDPLVLTKSNAMALSHQSVRWGLPLADAELMIDRVHSRDPNDFFLTWHRDLILSLSAGRVGDVDVARWGFNLGGPGFIVEHWLGYPFPALERAAAVVVDSLRRRASCSKTCRKRIMYYDVLHGDTVGVRALVTEMEKETIEDGWVGYGEAVVLALLESLDQDRFDTPALDTLEARLRRDPGQEWPGDLGMLILARLCRQRGENERALKAARSITGMNLVNLFAYRVAYLKEEGDLAAIVGDTAGAIKAYRHYLALRTDPDSGAVAQEVEEVRAALDRLLER